MISLGGRTNNTFRSVKAYGGKIEYSTTDFRYHCIGMYSILSKPKTQYDILRVLDYETTAVSIFNPFVRIRLYDIETDTVKSVSILTVWRLIRKGECIAMAGSTHGLSVVILKPAGRLSIWQAVNVDENGVECVLRFSGDRKQKYTWEWLSGLCLMSCIANIDRVGLENRLGSTRIRSIVNERDGIIQQTEFSRKADTKARVMGTKSKYDMLGFYLEKEAEGDYSAGTGLGRIESFQFSEFRCGSLTVNESVKEIGMYAFCCCVAHKITVPGTCKKIETGAFRECSVTEIEIQEGVTELGSDMFTMSYIALENGRIEIPESIEVIGGNSVEDGWNFEDLVGYELMFLKDTLWRAVRNIGVHIMIPDRLLDTMYINGRRYRHERKRNSKLLLS